MIQGGMRIGIAMALASLTLVGCSVFGGEAAPEPPHEVAVSEPPFEIRAYPALMVARTRVAAPDYEEAVETGFRRLFDYIQGANRQEAEIAMTAPVMSARDSVEIAMTASVLQEQSPEGWQVTFFLPDTMSAESAPAPTNPDVEITTIPARRVGVIRFSGLLTAERIAENRARLSAWLADRGEKLAGDWQAAGYNPPWTLPPLRHNEVMATLK